MSRPPAILSHYASIQQCAGATGVPASLLKATKRKGCPAFTGTRVHFDRWLKWYFNGGMGDGENEAESIDEAERRKAVAEADLKEIARAKAREELVPVAEVGRWGETVFVALRQAILSATELTERSKDELLANLQRLTRDSSNAAAIAAAGGADGGEAEPSAEADGG